MGQAEVSKKFHDILRELGEMHDRKQKDYGTAEDPLANVRASEDWGIPAWTGAMVRATDKLKRLQTYVKKGTLANEGVEDSLIDLAVYSIIALMLFREKSFDWGKAFAQADGYSDETDAIDLRGCVRMGSK